MHSAVRAGPRSVEPHLRAAEVCLDLARRALASESVGALTASLRCLSVRQHLEQYARRERTRRGVGPPHQRSALTGNLSLSWTGAV